MQLYLAGFEGSRKGPATGKFEHLDGSWKYNNAVRVKKNNVFEVVKIFNMSEKVANCQSFCTADDSDQVDHVEN